MKIASRTVLNWYCFFDRLQLRFFLDFGSIFGAIWEALGGIFGQKSSEGSKDLRTHTYTHQNLCSEMPRRPYLGAFLDDWGASKAHSSMNFWSSEGAFSIVVVLCCAVLCCVVLCCVALCCVVLCVCLFVCLFVLCVCLFACLVVCLFVFVLFSVSASPNI